MTFNIRRPLCVSVAGLLLAAPCAGIAQGVPSAPAEQTVGADKNSLAFDVISIREDKTEPSPQNPPKYGPTTDGYRLKGPPLTFVIRAAYLPSPGSDTTTFGPRQLEGVPAWVNQVHYEIDAKVSEADLPKWKDPEQQPAMLRAMLQAMLTDRFKLVVHRESTETPIYEMTVAGNGPKFKPSTAGALAEIQRTHPNAGNSVALGGAIVSPGARPGEQMIYGITMPAFGAFLSNLVGRPIRDKTGLAGRYDITYQMDESAQDSAGPAAAPNDLSAQILSILREQLGLQLKPAKGSVETLVIDHIEPPSQN